MRTQNPPPLKACRFDSDLGHHLFLIRLAAAHPVGIPAGAFSDGFRSTAVTNRCRPCLDIVVSSSLNTAHRKPASDLMQADESGVDCQLAAFNQPNLPCLHSIARQSVRPKRCIETLESQTS